MIITEQFGAELKKLNFSFYSGVPCSYLKNLINYAINDCNYIAAANEGDAIAIASGACLGGRRSVVLMQNSGLANAVSPLVSLNYPFHIPLLGFVSLRGEPGVPDEPQHELIGCITTQLLELMDIEWQYLSPDIDQAKEQLQQAVQVLDQNKSFFFVVKKNTFSKVQLHKHEFTTNRNLFKTKKEKGDQLPSRLEALSVINASKDKTTVQIATTGKTGRELYEIGDSNSNLYLVGSMGCVSSLGLGMALTQQKHDIIVIDGDGSLLMRMGSLATNGFYGTPNMLHILLDNNAHDSTGGQSTVSNHVDFVDIAAACGYGNSLYLHDLNELDHHILDWKRTKGLTFLYIKIAQGSKETLGRPHIKPHEVTARLKKYLGCYPRLLMKGE
jgi:phosphonopyruvate decarboxylase